MKKPSSAKLTPGLATQIRELAKSESLHQHQIAALVGVNQGRVSEVLTGKKFPEVEKQQQMKFS